MINATLLVAVKTGSMDKMLKALGFVKKRKAWPDCVRYEHSGSHNGISLPLLIAVDSTEIGELAFV